jgi:hypothetical protein
MTKEFGDDCMAYRANVQARAESSKNKDLGAIWVDDAIGAVYKALERTGQLADTVIVFQLDHGMEEKDKIWEGGIQIPQFIHYPNGFGQLGEVFHGLVSTIDLGPSFLDYAGITEASPGWYPMDGTSWKAAVENDAVAAAWRADRCLFFESNRERAVRCGCEKYTMLSDSSPEKAVAIASGWWSDSVVMANLCDVDGNYIVWDDTTQAGSPEAMNILSSNPERAGQLEGLLQCHLAKTDANVVPVYDECTLGGPANPPVTLSPVQTPVTGAPVAPMLPSHASYSPLDNVIASGNDVVLEITVIDDNIRNVAFEVRDPLGGSSGFNAGSQVSSGGDSSTWSYHVDTSSSKGQYRYRFRMRDFSDNIVTYPESGFIEFYVLDTAEQLLDAARDEIGSVINAHPENLAAKIVRMGFHDCVGGCDGCIDMLNQDNAGLQTPIDALKPVVQQFALPAYGVTRADIWVLATLEAARGAQGPDDLGINRDFSMNWYGRQTCEEMHNECLDALGFDQGCTDDRGPHRDLPSPDLTNAGLLHFFLEEFGFDERETVAIMGAHTLGTLSRENSGFNGDNGWLGNTDRLDSGYYDALVGGDPADYDPATYNLDNLMFAGNWNQVCYDNSAFPTPNRCEWERGTEPNHFVMVNSDMALVRDLTILDSEGKVDCQFRCNRPGCMANRCPHASLTIDIAAEYKHNNDIFLEDFEAALKKMLEKGYDTSGGCIDICELQVAGRRRKNLRE